MKALIFLLIPLCSFSQIIQNIPVKGMHLTNLKDLVKDYAQKAPSPPWLQALRVDSSERGIVMDFDYSFYTSKADMRLSKEGDSSGTYTAGLHLERRIEKVGNKLRIHSINDPSAVLEYEIGYVGDIGAKDARLTYTIFHNGDEVGAVMISPQNRWVLFSRGTKYYY